MLIDPTDVLRAGVSDWAPISALIGEEFNAFAWRLTDGGILGVEDFETNSFKHLVKNNQLLISSDLKINNVAIYNSLGQKVASQSVNATSARSEEHTSELQSRGHLVCRLLLEKKSKRRS